LSTAVKEEIDGGVFWAVKSGCRWNGSSSSLTVVVPFAISTLLIKVAFDFGDSRAKGKITVIISAAAFDRTLQ
jgi:hypothetical protein